VAQPPQHEFHPPLLFRGGQARRNQDDRPVPVAIGRDGPPTTGASAHLNSRIWWHGFHVSPESCGGPGARIPSRPDRRGRDRQGRVSRTASGGPDRWPFSVPFPQGRFRPRSGVSKISFSDRTERRGWDGRGPPHPFGGDSGVNTGVSPAFVGSASRRGAAPATGRAAAGPRSGGVDAVLRGRGFSAGTGRIHAAAW